MMCNDIAFPISVCFRAMMKMCAIALTYTDIYLTVKPGRKTPLTVRKLTREKAVFLCLAPLNYDVDVFLYSLLP